MHGVISFELSCCCEAGESGLSELFLPKKSIRREVVDILVITGVTHASGAQEEGL